MHSIKLSVRRHDEASETHTMVLSEMCDINYLRDNIDDVKLQTQIYRFVLQFSWILIKENSKNEIYKINITSHQQFRIHFKSRPITASKKDTQNTNRSPHHGNPFVKPTDIPNSTDGIQPPRQNEIQLKIVMQRWSTNDLKKNAI